MIVRRARLSAGGQLLVVRRGDRLAELTAARPRRAREFSFEHELDRVLQATSKRAIDYPVAVDNDYAVWSAFDNHYWPALYFLDDDGIVRDQQFGEGRYEQSERVIQELLGSSASSSASKASGSRHRPTGSICAHPRPTSTTRAPRTSPPRAASPPSSAAPTSSPSAWR
jgi:hypothetical protein